MGLAILYGALIMISVGLNIGVRAQGVSWAAFWLQTLCGVEFVAAAIAGHIYVLNHYGDHAGAYAPMAMLFVFGALAGIIGDIVLALKDLLPKKRLAMMLSGLLFFGIGHILYIIGIMLAWHASLLGLGGAIVASAVIAVAFVLAASRLGLDFGVFKVGVMVYGTLLVTLTGAAVVALFGHNDLAGPGLATQPVIVGIGGLCFLVSDIVLGYTYFGKNPETPLGHAMCYVFYYAAQFMIALSLFTL
jgi:hypothetical protein